MSSGQLSLAQSRNVITINILYLFIVSPPLKTTHLGCIEALEVFKKAQACIVHQIWDC